VDSVTPLRDCVLAAFSSLWHKGDNSRPNKCSSHPIQRRASRFSSPRWVEVGGVNSLVVSIHSTPDYPFRPLQTGPRRSPPLNALPAVPIQITIHRDVTTAVSVAMPGVHPISDRGTIRRTSFMEKDVDVEYRVSRAALTWPQRARRYS
jgi:hypothetical protein